MISYMQRGVAAAKARKLKEAVQCFETALQENPGDLQARIWLGQSLCAAGRREEGLAYLRDGGRFLLDQAGKCGDISRVLELTAQLQQWNDFSGALELVSAAVQINSSVFRGFQLLAVSYSLLNKRAEAVQAGKRALELAPDHTMMQILQGSLEGRCRPTCCCTEAVGKGPGRPFGRQRGISCPQGTGQYPR